MLRKQLRHSVGFPGLRPCFDALHARIASDCCRSAQTDAERFVGDYTLISCVTYPRLGGGRHEICGQFTMTGSNMSGLGMPSGCQSLSAKLATADRRFCLLGQGNGRREENCFTT